MPRLTPIAWWCGTCNSRNDASARICVCGASKYERHAQVHASERAVIYYNPLTGEHRTPPRNDMPMPEQYARDGYERREIMNMTEWERESGVIHEASNYNTGNEVNGLKEPSYAPKPEVIHKLAKDMADAFASGPFTGAEKLIGPV